MPQPVIASFFAGPSLFLLLFLMGGLNAGADSENKNLIKGLTEAVCDEAIISRPPTLISTLGADSRGALKENLPRSFYTTMEMDEADLIGLMMDNRSAWMTLPQNRTSKESELKGKKKQISAEICRGAGALTQLFQKKPQYFIPLHKTRKNLKIARNGVGLKVHDIEGRFGKIKNKWWVAGWIEPYEISLAVVRRRKYVRLSHPVTNELHSIVLFGRNNIPLGYFQPTVKIESLSWKTLTAQPETHQSKQKKLEIYRMLLEIEAYKTLAFRPGDAMKIRSVQEFYKSLINAYLLYPQDARFEKYRKKASRSKKEHLGGDFFLQVRKARVNGSPVRLAYLQPDIGLHGIYLEYVERLRNSGHEK